MVNPRPLLGGGGVTQVVFLAVTHTVWDSDLIFGKTAFLSFIQIIWKLSLYGP